MAFRANVANPETGHILKKDEVYVKVVSTGSGKEPIIVRNEDGGEKHDEYGNVVRDYGWVLFCYTLECFFCVLFFSMTKF
ncbi:MAG: hypothetical protein IKP99_04595 [Bacteroidales bacterium]|nr:hypothetical protein [Bacteroidales bacterium]